MTNSTRFVKKGYCLISHGGTIFSSMLYTKYTTHCRITARSPTRQSVFESEIIWTIDSVEILREGISFQGQKVVLLVDNVQF